MTLIIKKKAVLVITGILLAVSIDASAIPFYGRQNRGAQAQTQSDSGQSGLMTGYTQDVQSGLSDFQFLARNFSGSNSGPSRGVSVTGQLGNDPLPTTGGGDIPAPIPGSLALLGLGLSALAWSRRK